jgi:hypothetical protein
MKTRIEEDEDDIRRFWRIVYRPALQNAINDHPLIVSYYWTMIAEYFTHE